MEAVKDYTIFSNNLFWDVDPASIDFNKHSRYVVERVLTRGNRKDWESLKKTYGRKEIGEIALKIRSMDKRTLSFLCTYFDKKKEDFRCT